MMFTPKEQQLSLALSTVTSRTHIRILALRPPCTLQYHNVMLICVI